MTTDNHIQAILVSNVNSDVETFNRLTPETLFDFLNEEVLDLQLTRNVHGYLTGAVLITAVGGPHVEIDTRQHTVTGWWGGTTHTAKINGGVCDMFNDERAEIYPH